MKWQHVIDRERDTALAEALLSADSDVLLDEDDGDASGRINVYASHWRELELRVVDEEARAWFGYGNCFALAWEMHVLTRWPLVLVVPVDDADAVHLRAAFAHAALAVPDGRVLDIFGMGDVEAMVATWSGRTGLELHAVALDPQDAVDLHRVAGLTVQRAGATVEQAISEMYSPLEREVVRDFSAHVLGTVAAGSA